MSDLGKKRLAVLGSTGSIGTQTLDIAWSHPEALQVVALAAGTSNLDLLCQQACKFSAKFLAVPDSQAAFALQEKLADAGLRAEIFVGAAGLCTIASLPDVDLVVSGVVGSVGVLPTAAAVKCGKTVALANKETLVAAGPAIMPLVQEYGAKLIPVDSEHSAIFQAMAGHCSADVRKILLTASGGPFRTWTREAIQKATLVDALKHPNWSMGQKITIDSATLMNKGLEIIEARWLFDMPAAKIEVIIHPQSILHSAVEYEDGSVVGQLGVPDMHLPIHYALFYPHRVASEHVPPLDLVKIGSMTFEAPDVEKFPCLALAKEAASTDDTAACVLNASNEVAVEAFLRGAIGMYDIPACIENVMRRHQTVTKPSLDDILEADRWAREMARDVLGAVRK